MKKLRLMNRIIGAVLGGKGQILLLIILLFAVITGRFVWFQPVGIPIDRLGYVAQTSEEPGAVVFSNKGGGHQLILEGEDLRWKGDEIAQQITQDVVNLHFHQGRIWVKTRKNITEINMQTGVGNQLLSVEDMDDGGSFENARLVGVEQDKRFYLASGDLVRIFDGKGMVEGPYFFDGRRTPKLIEPNWRQGVVFIQGNTWILYLDFRPGEPIRLDYQLGELQEVLLSPDGSYVVYAVQQSQSTEIWYARVNGADPQLLYYKDKIFSSLEAVWSPDASLLVLTILGYETDGGYEDNFISATLLYQPGQQGTVSLARSHGPEVRALVPTAWDLDEYIIWFYWLHEEQVFPVSYSLFRK